MAGALATFQSFVGIGLETTPGTPVTATSFISIASQPKNDDSINMIADKAWRGSSVAVFNEVMGMKTGKAELDGNMYLNDIGFMLQSLLPDHSMASADAPTVTLGAQGSGSGTAGAQFWVVTALGAWGESLKSNQVTFTESASWNQVINWTAVTGATGYKIYRSTTSGTYGATSLAGTVAAVTTFTDSGAATTTGTPPSSGPETHTFAAYNSADGQPKSYTILDYDGDQYRQFAGSKCNELSLKFDAKGLVTYSSKWDSFGSVLGSAVTPSFPNTPPIAAYTGVIKAGGSVVSNVESGEFTIKRKAEPITTIEGVQAPYEIFSGLIEVSGKYKAVLLASDPMLGAYLANTNQAQDITFAAPTGGTSLNLHCSSAIYTKAAIDRSKEYVGIDVEFTALGNLTDVGASAGYSNVKATLVNSVGAGVYA